jgi:hypothetical protein
VKLYRAMTPDIDGKPQIGQSARKLGVRALDQAPNNDVDAAVAADVVTPGKGMSVAPNAPANLIPLRRPIVLGGRGKDPAWEIDTDDLGPDLRFTQDSPTHGLIEPAHPMTLAEFEQALAATRAMWVRHTG